MAFIDPSQVASLLLPIGWVEIEPGSFSVEAFAFESSGEFPAEVEEVTAPQGFAFRDHTGTTTRGPLTSIFAVRMRES